jgi:uncharacterized OsmC-like protein
MSEEEKIFSVSIERENGFVFRVDFGLDEVEDLIMDEPEPVGAGSGPNASRVLAAAVANCLSASLIFCLQRAKAEVKGMRTRAEGRMRRNEEGRWRIAEIDVEITPDVDPEFRSQMERCLSIFEDFCIVSKSIEQGIPLNVTVDWG